MNHKEYLLQQEQYTKKMIEGKKITSRERILNLINFSKGHIINNFSDPQILCIGCRDGTEINLLESQGFKNVSGIDLYSNHKKVQIMDMHNLKFPNNSFDVIFACHSLEHGNEPRKYVNEIVRCLKSDGILIFEVPVDFKKNTRKDGEVVFDKTPRFSGDVDIIDFENVELFNSIMLKSASTKILKSKKIKTTQPKPKAQGNLKAVIKIAKEK